MKKVVRLAGIGLFFAIISQSYSGCWCTIPTFDECINEMNLVIRSLNNELRINDGSLEYSINSRGLIKGYSNGVQIKQKKNGAFDVSMLNGSVNFRARNEKNGLWHLMPFNTDYSGKLAFEADYIDLCNVKADKVVISAKKDQVENLGALYAQDIKILSHYIYNKDLIQSLNSNSQIVPQTNDLELDRIFASGFKNQNGQHEGFWNEGIVRSDQVDTKELKTVDLCGNVDIERMNSDEVVNLGYLPTIRRLHDYNIKINQLNAPNITVWTSGARWKNGFLTYDDQYNKIKVGFDPTQTEVSFEPDPSISMTNVHSAFDINLKADLNPSLDSIQNRGNIIAQIPGLFKRRNQDCKTVVSEEIKKKAKETGFPKYEDLNKLRAEILRKKIELYKNFGIDPDYTWDQLPEELDKKIQYINEKCEAENLKEALDPDENIKDINIKLQELKIKNVSTENILLLMEELYKQKDKLVSDLKAQGRNLDQNDISTWDKLYNRIKWMSSFDKDEASLINHGETLCSLGKKVIELKKVALNQLEEVKQLKEKIMHLLYLIQIADDIDAIKFSLESQEPFVLFDPRAGDTIFKGQATNLNGVPCGNSTTSFLFIKAACAKYGNEVEYSDSLREKLSEHMRIPVSLFNFINRIVKITSKPKYDNLSDQDVESLIKEVEKLNFDSDANVPYLSKLLHQLKIIKLDWADIVRRFIHIKASFANSNNELRKLYYRVAVSHFMQNRPGATIVSKGNYSKRIKIVLDDLSKVFEGSRAICNFLHESPGNDMMKLAKIVDGDLRLVIYYGNLLSLNNYDWIQFPDFLTYLLMDDDEYMRNTSEWIDPQNPLGDIRQPLRFVSKNIQGEALFRKLIGNDYDNLRISFSNYRCSEVFIKALGIIFHGNSNQYRTIDAVISDLRQHPEIFDNSNTDFKAPLYDVLSSNGNDIKKGLLKAFSVLFNTQDYQNLYSNRPDYQNEGVYSDTFGKNRIMYLFNQFDKLIDRYNASGNNEQQRLQCLETISQMSGYLVQGFCHCSAGESRAIQTALDMMLNQKDAIPPELTISDLLQLSVCMHCQNIISSVFRFMEWKTSYNRKVTKLMDGLYRIDPSGLNELNEETMSIGYVYYVLNGNYGLPTENKNIIASPKCLRLYLLSQVGTSTPHINKALAAVYNSGDDDIKKFGADISAGEVGTDFHAIGESEYTFSNHENYFSRYSEIDNVQLRFDLNTGLPVYSCPTYDKFIKTIVFGLMNNTGDVVSGVSSGAFFGKIVEFFDNRQLAEKGENWHSFQTLLNSYLDEADTEDERGSCKQTIENRIVFYLLDKNYLLTGNKQYESLPPIRTRRW